MAVTGSRDVYWYWHRPMVVQRKLSNKEICILVHGPIFCEYNLMLITV